VSSTVADALAIGNGSAADFAPYEQGASEQLILGPQGGYMLTPTLRVDAASLGTDGSCVFLDWEATVEEQPAQLAHFKIPDAGTSGDRYWYWEMLPLFLSRDLPSLVDRACSITVAFADDGVGTSSHVDVLLTH
jgi:hypothetical protein